MTDLERLVVEATEAILKAHAATSRVQRAVAGIDAQAFGETVAFGQMLLFCAEGIEGQVAAVAARSAEARLDESDI